MALNLDTEYYVRVRHEGNSLGWSEYGSEEGGGIYSFRTFVGSINAPTIISPTSGLSIIRNSISIAINNPTFVGTDSHQMTDWQVTDLSGNVLVESLDDTSNLLSITLSASSSTATSAKVRVRVKGTNFGWSTWSEVEISLSDGIITDTGFLLYLNDTGDGVVIEHQVTSDGSTAKFTVALASQRGMATFGTFRTDTSLTNYATSNTNGTWYLNGGSAYLTASPNMTSSQIRSLWINSIDQNTAKQNCDVWMTYNSQTDTKGIVGVPAVVLARSKSIGGSPCDLPNIQQVMVLYNLANEIDSLDPTVSSYPTYALGSANSSSYWEVGSNDRVWSSTEYNSNYVRNVYYGGYCYYSTKDNTCAVVPVREI